MTDSILRQTEARFRAEPSAAISSPTVTATLVEGRAQLSAGAFNWEADLPAPLGGGNAAPSPTAYLLGALAGCAVAFISDILAPQFAVRIDGVTAVVRATADARGVLGVDGVASDFSDVSIDISVSSPDPQERIEPMLRAWEDRCPVLLALRKPVPVSVSTAVLS